MNTLNRLVRWVTAEHKNPSSFGEQPDIDMSIARLPNELLYRIFEFCGPFVDGKICNGQWAKLMRVCWRWHGIAQSVLYNQAPLAISIESNRLSAKALPPPPVYRLFRSLTFYEESDFASHREAIPLAVIGFLTSVRSLTVDYPLDSRIANHRTLMSLLIKMPLTHLDLRICHKLDTLLMVFDIPTLRHLNINNSFWDGFCAAVWRGFVPGIEDLEHVLPARTKRTSPITSLQVRCFNWPIEIIKRLFSWPAHLERADLHLLDVVYDGNAGDIILEILSPQASSLKAISLGSLPLAEGEHVMPSFSQFSCLEELTLFGQDLFRETPADAVCLLQIPSLKRLTLIWEMGSFLKNGSPQSLSEGHSCWLRGFLVRVRKSGTLPRLRVLRLDYNNGEPEIEKLRESAEQCGIWIVFSRWKLVHNLYDQWIPVKEAVIGRQGH
ncbi:uncharacterized protein KD926_001927 [Aspergillus affinis]|uniref:uncharacterized protein n=1 Tax=Aspergillus affinis TaxID=1070780 RepID=UPI0022FF37DB|nr:uncharacterized protein KD926_001927 [Aspergillus affinis]KAI9044103.1 hypothetical protein KD926_001927 [Aspergillus affinis]